MRLLPEIGEELILAWVGTKAFDRGYKYYEDDAILNPRLRGDSLIAECRGSHPIPYRVEIQLGPGGVLQGNCTCPAGEGGHCKHAAALMLTWVYEPVNFHEIPELDLILESRSKSELIKLIQNMIARHPDLEQMLELSALRQMDTDEELAPDQIFRQVQRAFSAAGGEWGDHAQIAESLQPILDLGDDFLEQDHIDKAAVVYKTLMESLVSHEDGIINDEEGHLSQILAGCEQGIQDCLEDLEDPGLRLSLLRALFDFYVWDVHAGGRGYADETPLILVGQSNSDEKRHITEWVQEALPKGDDSYARFRRRELGSLWLELAGEALDDEGYIRICRSTGLTQELVERLLALGRDDEALTIARNETSNYALTVMADLFEKYSYPELGYQLIHEQPNSETNIQLLSWLKEYASQHNQPQEALRLAKNLFWQAQSLENYNVLLEAAQVLGEHIVERDLVIEGLENARNFSLLVEIYLMENNLDQALAALERVSPELWHNRIMLLRRQVAQAAEESRPHEAVRLYLMLSEDLISKRSRGNYAEAARFLVQVRTLYQRLGEMDIWGRLIANLTDEYRRLPAFQDELRRAGLTNSRF